jgi:glycosyltransferase involved in cell wall biosynthesis
LNILIINAEDFGGGANKISISLLRNYNKYGHRAKLLVREKNCNNPNIISVNNDDCRNFLWQYISVVQKKLLNNNVRCLPKFLQYLKLTTEPKRTILNLLGLEDFEYPGFVKTLKKIKFKPDIIHCHNLHSDFFDLRILEKLSNSVPLFITLHDCWMLTGHCVYPYECTKWKTTCRKCPYPKHTIQTKRDASIVNQWRKKQIYRKSKLHISAPSIWLRKMAEKSILKEGAIEFRTIPNGINEKTFSPGCKTKARAKLGLCKKKKIILFAGSAATKNPAKGWNNLLNLLKYAKNKKNFPESVVLILGDTFKEKIYGNIILKSINWVSSEKELVNYYRASDLYLHLANAENFPLSILEAMHCGVPVVASNVGGIPEQIIHEKTGFVLKLTEKNEIIHCIEKILTNTKLHDLLSTEARIHALKNFSQDQMIKSYITWFEHTLKIMEHEAC